MCEKSATSLLNKSELNRQSKLDRLHLKSGSCVPGVKLDRLLTKLKKTIKVSIQLNRPFILTITMASGFLTFLFSLGKLAMHPQGSLFPSPSVPTPPMIIIMTIFWRKSWCTNFRIVATFRGLYMCQTYSL